MAVDQTKVGLGPGEASDEVVPEGPERRVLVCCFVVAGEFVGLDFLGSERPQHSIFRSKHSIVRVRVQATEKRKSGQQRQPATENTRPNTRTNARHGKTGARRREAPPTRRGSKGLHDHTPNGHRPYDHNGESPRKAGQRPEQLYTGPVQKRALYTRGPKSPKGVHTRYTEALLTLCRVSDTLFELF